MLNDGRALTDFKSIALWLAETYPRGKLLPDDPALAARAIKLLDYPRVRKFLGGRSFDFSRATGCLKCLCPNWIPILRCDNFAPIVLGTIKLIQEPDKIGESNQLEGTEASPTEKDDMANLIKGAKEKAKEKAVAKADEETVALAKGKVIVKTKIGAPAKSKEDTAAGAEQGVAAWAKIQAAARTEQKAAARAEQEAAARAKEEAAARAEQEATARAKEEAAARAEQEAAARAQQEAAARAKEEAAARAEQEAAARAQQEAAVRAKEEAAAASLVGCFQTIAVETTTYSKKALEYKSAFVEKLLAAKSFKSVIHIQSEYAKTSYAGYIVYVTKIGELYRSFATKGFKCR